ncbi:MAG: molybdenum cofactor biosynthesis protein MoaE [Methanosarcinales archaeon Met12]|nr:MAG: molybdenum cofactor biosynthesis protein MoaE [Methanosarcinales archaeon Met12]
MIDIIEGDFKIEDIILKMKNKDAGALVLFLGTVRVRSKGKTVEKLYFEAYRDVALERMNELKNTAMQRFDIKDVTMVHRIGTLDILDNIVLITVSAEHRKDAFAACEFLIDELKKVVPIWKKEFTTDGEYWVEGGVLANEND